MRKQGFFAASFVVTTSLVACGAQQTQQPPTNPPNPEPHVNPPGPTTTTTTTSTATAPNGKPLPIAPAGGTVSKGADGRCMWMEDMKCPPDATCNPPPPMEVQCPPGK